MAFYKYSAYFYIYSPSKYISFKIRSFQCFWVKWLYDDSFHAKKGIPLLLIKNYLGKFFLYHFNLSVEQCPGRPFPELSNLSRNKGIKMLHQNIRGLFNKIPDIQIILYEFNLHVLTLSEIHIISNNYNDEDSLYDIPGYDFIKKNRIKGLDGGVSMFISNTLKWQRRYDLEGDDLESIWIEIFPHNAKSFLLSTTYRPPDRSKYLFKNFNTLVNDTLNVISSEREECIIMGDTNINYLDKNNHNDIKDIFMLNGYKQLVTKATRITEDSKTLIDIIFTNKPKNISKTDTIPTSLSNHDMVGCARQAL